MEAAATAPLTGRQGAPPWETVYQLPWRGAGAGFQQAGRPGFEDRVYPPTKIAAVVDVLAGEGIAPPDILRGTRFPFEELHSPTARISLNQLIACYRNAVRLSQDPLLAYRIGANIHLSTYGMYGYAMLCSTNARRTMEIAVRYHPLATPATTISFAELDDQAIWTVEPFAHPEIDANLYRFITELQMGIHLSLHRDIMGEHFAPDGIDLAYAETGNAAALPAALGCPLRHDQPSNRMCYSAAWLDRAPRFGNRNTYAELIAMCDQLLNNLVQAQGVAGQVRSAILRDIADGPCLDSVAARLKVTPRSLRRQLKTENTAFQKLLDEVRTEIAAKYLRETAMTVEDIAFSLGFSDAANFRQAFRRWTGGRPRDYRASILGLSGGQDGSPGSDWPDSTRK